jgi:glucokinase
MHELNPLTSKRIFEAARAGDELALRIWDETGFYMAAAISSVMSLLNPEAIIILGSVANAGDLLLDPINKYLKGMVLASKLFEETALLRGTLGGFAGTVGAAGFARFR